MQTENETPFVSRSAADAQPEAMRAFMPVPSVIEETERGPRAFDVFSNLYGERVIMLGSSITEDVATVIIGQLLELSLRDPRNDIMLYINSGGGSITAAMAIVDTMNLIAPRVSTVCLGQCAGVATAILASGARGQRFALENARVVLRQPSGGFTGQVTDIELQAAESKRLKMMLAQSLSESTSKSVEEILEQSERDFYMDADEAVEYGIIDYISVK